MQSEVLQQESSRQREIIRGECCRDRESESTPSTAFFKLKPAILAIVLCSIFIIISICFSCTDTGTGTKCLLTLITTAKHNRKVQYQKNQQKIQQSHLFPQVETPSFDFNFNFQNEILNRRLQEEEEEEENPYETGSFANCNAQHKTSRSSNVTFTLTTDTSNGRPHPESSLAVISCRSIHYRAPLMEIEKGGHKVAVGVLSGAGGKGPLHRDSIRSTWASGRKSVYFIVAGPWNDIREEYDKYRDLIWIEEDEVYEGEESVLPFKTEAFIHILQKYTLPGKAGFEYLFKTDDDSFVDLAKLEKTIGGKKYDYWGCCTTENFKPLRSPTRKWRVTFDIYPEEYYPLYCQGAGFALSRKFVECMSNHLAFFRYNPFEDVSIGLLAERCSMVPDTDFVRIKQYRTEEAGEKKQLKNDERKEIFFLPKATMKNKVLQHRVKTHYDMYAHYKCVKEGC
jgi:hypothetical protein